MTLTAHPLGGRCAPVAACQPSRPSESASAAAALESATYATRTNVPAAGRRVTAVVSALGRACSPRLHAPAMAAPSAMAATLVRRRADMRNRTPACLTVRGASDAVDSAGGVVGNE